MSVRQSESGSRCVVLITDADADFSEREVASGKEDKELCNRVLIITKKEYICRQ